MPSRFASATSSSAETTEGAHQLWSVHPFLLSFSSIVQKETGFWWNCRGNENGDWADADRESAIAINHRRTFVDVQSLVVNPPRFNLNRGALKAKKNPFAPLVVPKLN